MVANLASAIVGYILFWLRNLLASIRASLVSKFKIATSLPSIRIYPLPILISVGWLLNNSSEPVPLGNLKAEGVSFIYKITLSYLTTLFGC